MQTRVISYQRRVSPNLTISRNDSKLSDVLVKQIGFLEPPHYAVSGSLRVVHCRIPVAFYNVPNGKNKFRYRYHNDDEDEEFLIDAGNYNYRGLQSAITSQINHITITFVPSTGKFRFSNNHPFTLYFDNNSLYKALGFLPNTTVNSVETTVGNNTEHVIQSPYLPDLQGETAAIFRTSSIISPNINSLDFTSYLVSVPLNTSLFGVAFWENVTNFSIPIDHNLYLNQFDIYVTNGQGDFLDFQLVPWELLLEVSYVVAEPKRTFLSSVLPMKRKILISDIMDANENQTGQESADTMNGPGMDDTADTNQDAVDGPTENMQNHKEEIPNENGYIGAVQQEEEMGANDGEAQETNNGYEGGDTIENAVENRVLTEKTVTLQFPQFAATPPPDTAFDLTL